MFYSSKVRLWYAWVVRIYLQWVIFEKGYCIRWFSYVLYKIKQNKNPYNFPSYGCELSEGKEFTEFK